MLALKYKFNYSWRILLSNTIENVGVVLKDKTVRYYRWLGFIETHSAIYLGNKVASVKLEIDYYSLGETQGIEWHSLTTGEYIHSCVVLGTEGVFGVISKGVPKVIKGV